MHDLFVLLAVYVRGAWRYRWVMLVMSWLLVIIGWAVVAILPDQYEASARTYVDTQSVLKPLLRGLAIDDQNRQRRILLMTRTLLSRPNLEKVMRMTDMDLQARDDVETEEIVDKLAKEIKIKGLAKENLYTITYVNKDPELAKLVVKSLLTIFMESGLGESRKQQDNARQFLEQQIEEYERRLSEAESTLKLFKQRNLGYMSGESGGYYQRLMEAQQQMAQSELDLRIEKDRLEVLTKQLEGQSPSFGVVMPEYAEPSATEFDERINSLQSRLDGLMLQYTDKHPDIISIKKTLGSLKKKQKETQRKRYVAKASSGTSRGTVLDQFVLERANAEASIAGKETMVEEYKNRVSNMESAIDRVLRVESEGAQLNRDYGVLKKNHEELLSRLESARLSRKAESRGDTVQFRVIDPPRVPPDPSGPNRLLYSTGVLLAGLGFGIAIAFLLSQLRPTFDDRKLLSEITNLPVLGGVQMVWTSAQVRQRKVRNYTFMFVLLLLLSAYAAVMTVHFLDLDVVTKLQVYYKELMAYAEGFSI